MENGMHELSKFDTADYLRTDDAIRYYLDEALSEDDPKAFLQALNTIARAKGMTNLARETGIPRENLYQSLSEKGNPGFYTLWKIANALGYSLTMRKKERVA